MCNCQAEAKGRCWQTSHPAAWLPANPRSHLAPSMLRHNLENDFEDLFRPQSLSPKQMFPSPPGDLVCLSWDIAQSSQNYKATGSQPEHGGIIRVSVLPFPCGIPQALMEILLKMKAESSICCFNHILNLTPSDKPSGMELIQSVGHWPSPGGKEKEGTLFSSNM